MLQVDLPILSTLCNRYEIDWYIWGGTNLESSEFVKKYAEENKISLSFIESPYHSFNPLSFSFCDKTIKSLRDKDYSAYYFDISTFPWLLFCIKKYIPANRVIIAMHHGKIHSGMRFKPLYRPFLKYLNKQPFFLQYFSRVQAEAFNGNDLGKKYIIPLALNDFGKSDTKLENKTVVFTAFGNIIETKGIPLLIEAANRLWEQLGGGFKVRIVGRGRFWQSCSQLIRHPDAFYIDIRRIPEKEIPNLFASSHYMVFPYKAVTQSGPLRIAYGYNVPVIASDLDGFRESVEDGITGLLFRANDVDSLLEVMRNAIEKHPVQYNKIKASQSDYIRSNLSTDSVCAKYMEMFDKILS